MIETTFDIRLNSSFTKGKDALENLGEKIGLIILFIVYYIYASFSVALGLLFVYLFSLTITYCFTKRRVCFRLLDQFYFIYGLLLILTQYFYIDGIDDGFFFHIDASKSFYYQTELYIDNISWSNLIIQCFFLYPEYPLAQVLFSGFWLFGVDIGVPADEMRLFLRIQDLFFSTFIIIIIAKYLSELYLNNKQIKQYCYLFGFFSYLFITSVIFSRDLHVAFAYTLLGYLALSRKNHSYIYIKFIILIIFTFGLRIENGLFALMFPLYYYFRDTRFSKASLIIIVILGIIVFAGTGAISKIIEIREGFNEHTTSLGDGLYNKINSLPFPINMLFNFGYSFISPFPFIQYVIDPFGGIFTITSIVSPFLRVIMLVTIIFWCKHHPKRIEIIYLVGIIVLYMLMCSMIEPNLRRLFAVIPTMFLIFCSCNKDLDKKDKVRIITNTIIVLMCLNIPSSLFILMK